MEGSPVVDATNHGNIRIEQVVPFCPLLFWALVGTVIFPSDAECGRMSRPIVIFRSVGVPRFIIVIIIFLCLLCFEDDRAKYDQGERIRRTRIIRFAGAYVLFDRYADKRCARLQLTKQYETPL